MLLQSFPSISGVNIWRVNENVQLFLEKKIQILIATATLAWGINMPAHLVIVKGTEYYDGKTCSYVDFPVTGEFILLLITI